MGWVCALPSEYSAARALLDEEHQTHPSVRNDSNLYTLGGIGEHNVVVACLPKGQMGTVSAADVALQMKSTYTSIRFDLMVGIGGGVPGKADIRLGDVVISAPSQGNGGVVQYDFGSATPTGFKSKGFLNAPPKLLLNAVSLLESNHAIGRGKLLEYLSSLEHLPEFARKPAEQDILYQANYNHTGGDSCEQCSEDEIVKRTPRQEVVIHYGTIASGNQVIRDGATRDRVSDAFGGVLCFEMEAAGLMNSFPCLVIRGICDYADSHKHKRWQGYAAGTAASCAKEVLSVIPPADVAKTRTVDEIIDAGRS